MGAVPGLVVATTPLTSVHAGAIDDEPIVAHTTLHL
jgi:hypothetical protein